MQVAYCENCGKHTGHKRSIGVGTALGAVVTGGMSLLAVPAYGKRCIVCGLTESEAAQATAPHLDITTDGGKVAKYLLVAIICIAAILIVYFNLN